MKQFAIISLCVLAAALCVSAGSGYYVPRAYFTIDENGQQSPIYNFDPVLVHRVRRSPQFASTSSSTSTSTSSGNVPLFFNPLPGFNFPNAGFGAGFPNQGNYNNQGAYPGQGSSTFTSSSTTTSNNNNGGGGLDNRFGGDDTKVTGHTQTTSTHNGQFTHTSSHLGDDGKVHFNVQSGKF